MLQLSYCRLLLVSMESHIQDCWILISSIFVFVATYAIGFYFIFPRWKLRPRLDAASCCMSMIHATFATSLSMYALTQSSLNLDALNTGLQNKVMEFSTAYFLVDLLHYFVFVPEDFHFILHHVATTTYILSCRYFTRHGAVSVMVLLGLAEMTAPVQNIWTITGLASQHYSTLASRIHNSISPFFTVYFTMTRGVAAPFVAWKFCRFYFTGLADSVIPRWLAAYWMMTVILAIVGSLLWVSKLWVQLLRKNADEEVQKED